MSKTSYRKKLIEVALPLEAINKASAREKSLRHGHPSTLHLWWARRPLAAARAVIFAQMVDDPSEYIDVLRADARLRRKAEGALKQRLKVWEEARILADKTKGTGIDAPEPGPKPTLDEVLADIERRRLFRIVEDLVVWENTTNETVLQAARDEIWQSWRRACAENADHRRANELFDRHALPQFHDPFAGGGALPLEAQRLGLEANASDLNPVAVLLNKAMIEIPSRFAHRTPVNPHTQNDGALLARQWQRAQGLAEDVEYYGHWMRDEAERRIGRHYPKVNVTAELAKGRPDLKPYIGKELTVIAWIWARTVKSPNPAFSNVDVPLATTFWLSTKPGSETYVEPVVEGNRYEFKVRVGKPKNAESVKRGTKAGSSGSSFLCLLSGTPIPFDYIRPEAKAGRLDARLMAIVAEGDRGRIYLSPTSHMEAVAKAAKPEHVPDGNLPSKALGFRVQEYGMTKWGELFTQRQLAALTTFSDLIQETHEIIRNHATAAGLPSGEPLRSGGDGAVAYADAVATYLALAVDKGADYWSTICFWHNGAAHQKIVNTFGRQAIPMSWDFAEANPFSESSGHFLRFVSLIAEVLNIAVSGGRIGHAEQADAATVVFADNRVVSTDPPYYDNIGYADLSDFFYIWLRRSLRHIFPDLFATLAVPKVDELIATPFRHASKDDAEVFFLSGMTRAMQRLAMQSHPEFPVTIYYAFKQTETSTTTGRASTGWETFLEAVIAAGFGISGTWPMRTEYTGNLKKGIAALASSIILVCRPRDELARDVTRREFVNALKAELPQALSHLQRSNIAPVDLAQAAIGPGMAVYTRYSNVLDAEGRPLRVREALALINEILDESLAEQEGDFDADSRWALTWFEQFGFEAGEYGFAEQLSKSKNTSVGGMVEAGIIESRRGKVRLLTPTELPEDWDPALDSRRTAWEIVHHFIRVLDAGGETSAAMLLSQLGASAEVARELAYRLYSVSERKNRAPEALSYNALVRSWPEIVRLALERIRPESEQRGFFAELEA